MGSAPFPPLPTVIRRQAAIPLRPKPKRVVLPAETERTNLGLLLNKLPAGGTTPETDIWLRLRSEPYQPANLTKELVSLSGGKRQRQLKYASVRHPDKPATHRQVAVRRACR